MNIFITGGTGFIGSRLIHRLLEVLSQKDRILALVRSGALFEDPRVIPLKGSLEAIGEHAPSIREVDVIFHLGGIATFGQGEVYRQANLEPTAELIRLAASAPRLRNFVFTSTIGAFDRAKGDPCREPLAESSTPAPNSDYGRSKLACEKLLRASSLPWTIIRPTWVYGAGMRPKSHIHAFVDMVLAGSPVTRLRFPGRVSLIHVDDLCVAMVRCLDNPDVRGKSYFAATQSFSLGAIFETIHRHISGRTPRMVPVPDLGGLLRPLHHRLPLTLSNLFLDYLWADDRPFRRDFGLERPIPFETGVADVVRDHVSMAGCWIVTGANSGIGLALSRELRDQGRALVLADRRVDNLGEFPGATVVQTDLATPEGVEALAQACRGRRIACLVNNAGVGFRRSILTITEEEILLSLRVNAQAPILLVRKLLADLTRSGSTIVNIASTVAYNPLPHMALYSSTKALISNWSESLTYELRDTNHVLTFSPAGTLTNFQQEAGVRVLKEGRGLYSPEEVARRILAAVKARKTVVVMDPKSKLLLLVSRFLPRTWNIKLWGKLFESLR